MAINPFEPPRASSRGTLTRDYWLLKAAASVTAFSLLHVIAFFAIVFLCDFVVQASNYAQASNTIASWLVSLLWLCRIAVQILAAVVSLPLVLPAWLSKAGVIPAPLFYANSIVWGIGLHGLKTWIHRRRRRG